MALMLANARAAFEATGARGVGLLSSLASLESGLSRIDRKLNRISDKLSVALWMVGANVAATIAIPAVPLYHG